jgi:uncharacterized OsmC-like protein
MSDSFAVSLAQWENFQFLIDFNQDGVTDLLTDEPEPVGQGKGPDPARLLATAVGNCLASSLLFCLRKAKIPVNGIKCVVEGKIERNAEGRLRVTELRVKVEPTVGAADVARVSQCTEIFEKYCTISQSVIEGIAVKVEVTPVTQLAGGIIA